MSLKPGDVISRAGTHSMTCVIVRVLDADELETVMLEDEVVGYKPGTLVVYSRYWLECDKWERIS